MYWIFLVLIGLCWGSFLNVLIVRTLSSESIILPASKCPACNTRLKWWQNIPILSFLLLKGKCWWCNKPISIQYPIVEILGAIIVIFGFVKNISKIDAISVIFILSMLLVISITDFKAQKISIFQLVLIIIFGLLFNRHDMLNSIFGGLLSACLLALIIRIGLHYFKKETFGLGDIYLFGALGTVVGFDKIYLYLIYALLIQFIFILPKYVTDLVRAEQKETLRYLIFFWLTCLFLYFLKNISFWGSNLILMAVLAAIIYFAYKSIKNILKSLKSNKEPTYSPFAPAIALSCLMFFC